MRSGFRPPLGRRRAILGKARCTWPISFTAIFKSRIASAFPPPASSRAASIVQMKARLVSKLLHPIQNVSLSSSAEKLSA
jgi:hypothetical protein